MDKELLEILDTTVKIGLGALISGASAYILSITKYKKDKVKDKRDKTIQYLEEIALKVQEADTSIAKASHELWHLAAGTESATYAEAKKTSLNYYLEAISLFSHADTIARLINENDIHNDLEKIGKLIAEVYEKSALNNIIEDEDVNDEINEIYNKVNILLNSCFKKIGDAYCNS